MPITKYTSNVFCLSKNAILFWFILLISWYLLGKLATWGKNLLHIHDQKWAPDGLKVEIIISGGRADLNVKAKNHRAAELKHENWHEHRQLLEALYYCLIQQLFVGNLVVVFLVFFVRKQLCVSNLTFSFIINSIPLIFTKLSNITCVYPDLWISVSEAFC